MASKYANANLSGSTLITALNEVSIQAAALAQECSTKCTTELKACLDADIAFIQLHGDLTGTLSGITGSLTGGN